MAWDEPHRLSEQHAGEASLALARGDRDGAVRLYAIAADYEEQALLQIDAGRPRTLGIVAVSAVALWFKAREYKRAETLALKFSLEPVPEFAAHQLRVLLQAIWTEDSKSRAGVSFLPGQITVSIRGGAVVVGGAPLDLIVDKVQTIQAMFYRTIEHLQGRAFRLRGGPVRDIHEACKPWLFQALPGSYQFSVAMQEPEQPNLFGDRVNPDEVASRFLSIVKASTDDTGQMLAALIPEPQYRSAFLKLSRNLAPTGKSFDRLEMRPAGEMSGVYLTPETRTTINGVIRSTATTPRPSDGEKVTLEGTLRALHLDKDWLEVTVDPDKPSIRVDGLKETIDDLIGPMVNRVVRIQAMKKQNKYRFLDIEAEE